MRLEGLRLSFIYECFNSLWISCFYATAIMCTDETNLHARPPLHPRCGFMEEGQGEQAAMEPANERGMCNALSMPMPWREKVSQHIGAVQGVRVQQPRGPFKRSHAEPIGRRGAAKTHCQTLLTVYLPAFPSVCLPSCLSASSSACWGDFSN